VFPVPGTSPRRVPSRTRRKPVRRLASRPQPCLGFDHARPNRDLVAELNQKARAHRLQFVATSGPEAALADGNRASAGELIITRRNDRRLRTTATDWVKNGDRWTVLTVDRDGGLRVRHGRSGRGIRLPANYVRDFVELGYATTIHAAQGITADTMHGLLTGTESRQLLNTMCTRGRLSNHIYPQLLGNGDPHTLSGPTRYGHPPPPRCSNTSWPETTPQNP